MSVDKFIVRYIVGYYQKGCVTDNMITHISFVSLEFGSCYIMG